MFVLRLLLFLLLAVYGYSDELEDDSMSGEDTDAQDESPLTTDNPCVEIKVKEEHETMRFRRPAEKASNLHVTVIVSIGAPGSTKTIEINGKGNLSGADRDEDSSDAIIASESKENTEGGKSNDGGSSRSDSTPRSNGKGDEKKGRREPARSRSSARVFNVSPYSRNGNRSVKRRSKSSSNNSGISGYEGVRDRKSVNGEAIESTTLSSWKVIPSGSAVNRNGCGDGSVNLRSVLNRQ